MLSVDMEKRLGDFCLRVSFTAGEEMMALFGPSGSGKSLTLHCIAGLSTPDRGTITIDGRTVFDSNQGINLPPQQRQAGYVFQRYALFPHLTVEQNIAYGLHPLPDSESHRRMEEAIHRVRLVGLEKRLPHQLSVGQQQRVALARTLVTQPRVLLLDEPFSALDSAVQARLQGELMQLLRQVRITTILVTHNLAEAYALSERMIVYDEGRILQDGHRDEIIYRPRTRAVARFTGTKNFFFGRVISVEREHLIVETEHFTVIVPPYPYEVEQEVELCIRPESIMIVRPDQPLRGSVKENILAGEITDDLSRGAVHTLYVRLEGSPRDYDLEIDLPSHAYERLALHREKNIKLSLKKSAIHLIPDTI